MRLFSTGFVFMLACSVSSTAAASWWDTGPGYDSGYEAGYGAASRLWERRFHLDCNEADRFMGFVESLIENGPSSPGSHFRHGFEDGMRAVLSEVHADCLGPDGLCELGGRTTGEIAGRMICGTERRQPKMEVTPCGVIGYAACWTRLDEWVEDHCPDMMGTSEYDQRAGMCDHFIGDVPDTKPSCEELYGEVKDYVICQEERDSCEFHANLGRDSNCDELCGFWGGECLEAHGNHHPDNTDQQKCERLPSWDTCFTVRRTRICVCSRF